MLCARLSTTRLAFTAVRHRLRCLALAVAEALRRQVGIGAHRDRSGDLRVHRAEVLAHHDLREQLLAFLELGLLLLPEDELVGVQVEGDLAVILRRGADQDSRCTWKPACLKTPCAQPPISSMPISPFM